jgi:prepilin-type N-terminal cleavage/methylation domain-containing protein
VDGLACLTLARRRHVRRLRRLQAQAGYTLIELIIAMMLALVVVGGPLTFIVVSINQQNAVSSRSFAATQAETGLEQLTRDLRQIVPGTASSFTWSGGSASTASASFTLPTPGTQGASTESVSWTCTAGAACTRKINNGPAQQVIAGVTSASFAPLDGNGGAMSSPATSPAFVGVAIRVQETSQLDSTGASQVRGVTNGVTLQDGVDLRNNSL